ncbi:MAG: hypothetical protein KDI71_08890 [Xanthomonadales bacterium]|nr:hypothetical protein [Xanthomonadales bacterium]
MFGLTAIAFVVLLVKWMALRNRQSSIRRFLDSADALEAELHDCRDRIRALKATLAELPGPAALPAISSLDTDHQVTDALKLLLAHRLWLRNEAATASIGQINDAQLGIERSREKLSLQMRKLEDAGDELAKASSALPQAVSGGEDGRQPTLH